MGCQYIWLSLIGVISIVLSIMVLIRRSEGYPKKFARPPPALTKFSGDEREEFSQVFQAPPPSLTQISTAAPKLTAVRPKGLSEKEDNVGWTKLFKGKNFPAHFDARLAWPGCISAPQTQGKCGSCWAFAAAAVLGDRFCISTCLPWPKLSDVGEAQANSEGLRTDPLSPAEEIKLRDAGANAFYGPPPKNTGEEIQRKKDLKEVYDNWLVYQPVMPRFNPNNFYNVQNVRDPYKTIPQYEIQYSTSGRSGFLSNNCLGKFNIGDSCKVGKESRVKNVPQTIRDADDDVTAEAINRVERALAQVDCKRAGGRCSMENAPLDWLNIVVDDPNGPNSAKNMTETQLMQRKRGFFCGCCPGIMDNASSNRNLGGIRNVEIDALKPAKAAARLPQSDKCVHALDKAGLLGKCPPGNTCKIDENEPKYVSEACAPDNIEPQELYCMGNICQRTKDKLKKELNRITDWQKVFDILGEGDMEISFRDFAEAVGPQVKVLYPNEDPNKILKNLFSWYDINTRGKISNSSWQKAHLSGPIELSAMKLVVCGSPFKITGDKKPCLHSEWVKDPIQCQIRGADTALSRFNDACTGNSLPNVWNYLRDFGTVPSSCIGYYLQNWTSEATDTQKEEAKFMYNFCFPTRGRRDVGFVPGNVGSATCIEWVPTPENPPDEDGVIRSTNVYVFRAQIAYEIAGTPAQGGNEEQMMIEILQNGPISTGYTVYEDFQTKFGGALADGGMQGGQTYAGGNPIGTLIYKWDKESLAVGGHAIEIVGWGVFRNIKYWIIENSWGSDWGHSGDNEGVQQIVEGPNRGELIPDMPTLMRGGGYFWMLRGENECGIEENVVCGLPNVQEQTYPGSRQLEEPLARHRILGHPKGGVFSETDSKGSEDYKPKDFVSEVVGTALTLPTPQSNYGEWPSWGNIDLKKKREYKAFYDSPYYPNLHGEENIDENNWDFANEVSGFEPWVTPAWFWPTKSGFTEPEFLLYSSDKIRTQQTEQKEQVIKDLTEPPRHLKKLYSSLTGTVPFMERKLDDTEGPFIESWIDLGSDWGESRYITLRQMNKHYGL